MTLREAYLRLAGLNNRLPFSHVLPLYRVMAPVFDGGAKWLMPEYDAAIAQLLQKLDISRRDVLLDVACGTGKVLMGANGTQWRMGLDFSADMLYQLRRKTVLPIIRCDARRMALGSETFSVATSSFMLLHLNESERLTVFSEVWRVLQTGGRFGCLTADVRLGEAYATDASWRRWLTQTGFESVEIMPILQDYRVIIGRKPHEI